MTRLGDAANYGGGYAGTLGVPSLALSAPPAIGTATAILIGNSSGAFAPSFLVVSSEWTNVPTGLGGALLTEPQAIVPVPVPAAGAVVPWFIPGDASLVGVSLLAQDVQLDLGAPYLWAFTAGLRATIGP